MRFLAVKRDVSAFSPEGNSPRDSGTMPEIPRFFTMISSSSTIALRCSRMVLLLLLLAAGLCAGRGITYKIQSFSFATTPQIKEGELVYTVDICFDQTPQNYSCFYAKKSTNLVLECFDAAISCDSIPNAKKLRAPFKNIAVSNFNSTKSISGQQARIVLNLDAVWQYDIAAKANIVRISLHKKIEKSFIKKKEFHFIPYIAIFLLVAGVSFIAIQIAH
jgi:hypothetical protein